MANHPRGYYKDTTCLKWTKDTNKGYYNTVQLYFVWPFAKIMTLICVYYYWKFGIGCWHMGAISCIWLVLFYQRIIATIIPNTICMPIMD